MALKRTAFSGERGLAIDMESAAPENNKGGRNGGRLLGDLRETLARTPSKTLERPLGKRVLQPKRKQFPHSAARAKTRRNYFV
jgi:hypothetical protein